MNKEKVSIYIPAYNAEKTIKDCINSVINQSEKFDEIIVIDDNSIDNTLKILKEFKNIKIIENKRNMGLGYNRNLGIKASSNSIVASIDADVVLNTKWLEIMIKNMSRYENTMFGGKMTEKLIENKFNAWRAKYYSQNWGDKNLENPPFLYGCNTIQPKSIWINLNGYNEELRTNGEDLDYSNKINLSKRFKIYYSAEALCEHLQNDDLNTLAKRVWRYHSFGYKIKNPSIYKTIKLSIKQFKFFMDRLFKDLIKLNLNFVYINFVVLCKFILLEHNYYKKNKK